MLEKCSTNLEESLPHRVYVAYELLFDWSKTLFGSHDLVSGHTVIKSVLTHTPMLSE